MEPTEHGWTWKEHLAASDIAVKLTKAASKLQQGTAQGGGGGWLGVENSKRDQKHIANEESEAT